MGSGQKKRSVSVAVSPAPVRVPSQRPLAPSVASVTSVANDKDDNEMILGARRPSDEGTVRPFIASNGVPFLQMRSVGSHSKSGREREGIKERTGWVSSSSFPG